MTPFAPPSPSNPTGSRTSEPTSTATTETVALTNTRYVYRAQSAEGDDSLVVEIDVTYAPQVSVRDGQGATHWQFST